MLLLFSLSTGHQLPNFLSHLKRPTTKKSHKRHIKSGQYDKEEEIHIPIEIDQALEQVGFQSFLKRFNNLFQKLNLWAVFIALSELR